MKKILMLSIALLAAVPGLQAKCSSCTTQVDKKYECKGKKCACANKSTACTKCKKAGKKSCKCVKPVKSGPVKETLSATKDFAKNTVTLPEKIFGWLFGNQDEVNK